MVNTGIREGERARLKIEDIDLKNKRLLIRSSKAKDYRVIPMNEEVERVLKLMKENYIPPYSSSVKWLHRKEHQKEYVFCNEDGSPVMKIKRAFRNACRKAELKNVSPHTLRHTFASHLIMSGVDIRTVQRLLGHKSISTTMVYSHLTEDHLARSVEKLPWVNNKI
jgi:site-specific recombinase XerD